MFLHPASEDVDIETEAPCWRSGRVTYDYLKQKTERRSSKEKTLRLHQSAKTLPVASRSRSLFCGIGLPVLIEANIIRRKVGQNRSSQFKNVYTSEFFVENFAAWIQQQRVGNS